MNIGVIPARLYSIRMHKKILADIDGLPMVIYTANKLAKSNLDKIIIAVDDENVKKQIDKYGYDVLLTPIECKSGTDRVNIVAKLYDNADIIVNVQADEPLLDYKDVDKLIDSFDNPIVDMATLVSTKLSMNDLTDVNTVKAYLDENLYAIDFNRNSFLGKTIDNLGGVYKHIGIYAFRKNILDFIANAEQTDNEKRKRLEQMRALDNHIKIKAVITSHKYIGVDVDGDIYKVRNEINKSV